MTAGNTNSDWFFEDGVWHGRRLATPTGNRGLMVTRTPMTDQGSLVVIDDPTNPNPPSKEELAKINKEVTDAIGKPYTHIKI